LAGVPYGNACTTVKGQECQSTVSVIVVDAVMEDEEVSVPTMVTV
jgi:hypothetical protein